MASSLFSWNVIVSSLYILGWCHVLYHACKAAFEIRLYAIKEYGLIIHEFDPYFNYRATEYLWEHGWTRFKEWFDYMSWYPLGRPVGTTIYPGMQATACFLKKFVVPAMSINDICCYIPAWFGVLATLGTALLTFECTSQNVRQPKSILQDVPGIKQIYQGILWLFSFPWKLFCRVTGSDWGWPFAPTMAAPLECAVFAAMAMSVVPAHIMRSVGGGYDNESVATSAMVLTFAAWAKSLSHGHDDKPWQAIVWGTVTGVLYFYMVAAWGGYVFVLNLIGVHASVLVLLGRYSTKLHRAYTSFFAVGTFLAIQVPVVGWTPLKSLEQMGPLLAFGALQLVEFCEIQKRRQKLSMMQAWKLRVMVFGGTAAVAAILAFFVLGPMGYFGPVSARVRGLFVKHTKTGNPLVDSVAEHQAAQKEAYWHYLHDLCYLAPVGLGFVGMAIWNDASSFLAVYGVAAYYFSHRMVRLILLTAPIASVLSGVTLGYAAAYATSAIVFPMTRPSPRELWTNDDDDELVQEVTPQTDDKKKEGKKGKKKKQEEPKPNEAVVIKETLPRKDFILWRLLRAGAILYYAKETVHPKWKDFQKVSHDMARSMSHPTIVTKARTKTGQEVLVNDYRDAYFWLKKHTPKDARIMAWWDYGYQITGIANRTTLADGNTWNHEHIALLGRILTSPEKEGHRIARHLADYALVWAGGGGDDLAKSPHLIRIANSVYRGLCQEPTCRTFGFVGRGMPSPQMAASLLYKLHSHGLVQGVEADRNRFKEVYTSKYGKVRIFKILKVSKESKEWVSNPENRLCDVPGGWFCRGQYPPALTKILKEKKDFQQLEDFNVQSKDDSEYQRQYMENVHKDPRKLTAAEKSTIKNPEKTVPNKEPKKPKRLPQDEIDKLNEKWQNSEMTTLLFDLISNDKLSDLISYLVEMPQLAHVRSEDGRGPMWWAHEFGRTKIIEYLKFLGVSETRADANGVRAVDLSKKDEL